MAASTAVIANAALAHLGATGRIVTLSSDTTTEGKACRQFYPLARRQALAAAKWQSQTIQSTLTLVETFTATNAEWAFSYRMPEDCITPLRVLWEGIRNPLGDQQAPYRQVADNASTAWSSGTAYTVGQYASAAGVWYRCILAHTNHTPPNGTYWVALTLSDGPPPLVWTDVEDAVLEYVADLNDPTRFDPLLEAAIAAMLAWFIAPQITGVEPGTREHVATTYNALITRAQAHNYNAKQPDVPPVSTYQAARVRGRR